MRLQQLQYIAAVIQHGSIRKAAQNIFISEPAISKSLRELEAEYNVTLFKRSHSGMILTSDGEDFMVYARAILEHHSNLTRRFVGQEAGVKQYVRIAVRDVAGMIHPLINTINEISAEESFNIRLYSNNTSDIMEGVATGNIDLGVVVILSNFEEYWRSLFIARRLEFVTHGPQEHLYIAVRQGHPLEHKERVAMADLTPYPMLEIYPGGRASASFVVSEEIKAHFGLPDNLNCVQVYDSLAYDALLRGTDAFIPTSAVNHDAVFTKDGIVHHRIDTDIRLVTGTLRNPKRKMSDIELLFMDKLKAHYNTLTQHNQ